MGEAAGIGYAEVDAARVTDVRSRVPALKHRRVVSAPIVIA
jgi:hypothetical protein